MVAYSTKRHYSKVFPVLQGYMIDNISSLNYATCTISCFFQRKPKIVAKVRPYIADASADSSYAHSHNYPTDSPYKQEIRPNKQFYTEGRVSKHLSCCPLPVYISKTCAIRAQDWTDLPITHKPCRNNHLYRQEIICNCAQSVV